MTNFDNLKFSKSDEWLKIEGNVAILGITDHAQEALGEVIFFDATSINSQVMANESLGNIESVKAVSEIYAPCDAKILEVNPKIKDNPALINSDPYGDGWLVKIEITAPIKEELLSHKDYQEHIKNHS